MKGKRYETVKTQNKRNSGHITSMSRISGTKKAMNALKNLRLSMVIFIFIFLISITNAKFTRSNPNDSCFFEVLKGLQQPPGLVCTGQAAI